MSQSVSSATALGYDAGAQTARANSNSAVGKEDFLRLLTYQLKAQNPLKPYDNQEFASQLAQFSQLEQLTNIKSLIEEQTNSNLALSQTISNSALPGMLGKMAKVQADFAQYDGASSVKMEYSLNSAAKKATAHIYDERGNIVRTMELTGENLKSGSSQLVWDGKNDSGALAPKGKYHFAIDATDSKGSKIDASLYTYGKIKAVRFKNEGTMLVINDSEISLDKVLDISSEG